jgi:replicative DNA helicase
VWTARQSGVPVYFVSAEMSRRMLGFRMLSGEMGVASHLLRSGNVTEQQKAQMSAAQGRLSLLPIFIEDRIRDIDLVVAECYRMKREHDIGLFIIDYLQLLEPGKMEANANRERQVAKISGLLKQLAKDTDCPVIALCQLNRAIEYSAKRRPPQKSDLRDSGAIEQDLDVLIFLH